MEVADVENDWNYNYGHTCEESTVREALRLDKNDIYFDQPSKMGILGNDIDKDFQMVVSQLELDDVIDVEQEKKHLRQGLKAKQKRNNSSKK